MNTLVNSLGGWLGILILAVVVVVAIVIIVRMFRGNQRQQGRSEQPVGRFEQHGNERPRYDAPDVQSRGGFGGPPTSSKRDDDTRSGGGFGGRG